MKVVVAPYDPDWSRLFAIEATLVERTLGANVNQVHHIGSTAIPGMSAKPTVDLLVEVVAIEAVAHGETGMRALGYECLGEFGIAGRRYFRKRDDTGVHTHHVHTFEAGSPEVERHLAFRDFMRSHPRHAAAYSRLKRDLADAFPNDIEAYMDGKDAFIKEMNSKAATWRRSGA